MAAHDNPGNGGGGAARRSMATTLRSSHLMAGVAAIVVAGGILLSYQFVTMRRGLEADVRVHASVVAENISASMMFHDRLAAADMLRSFRPAPFLIEAVVLDTAGREFAAFRRPGARNGQAPAPLAGWRAPLVVAQPVVYRERTLGRVVLVADTAIIRRGLLNYGMFLGFASVGALMASALISRRSRARVALAERELAWLAYTDPVTGLPNRRACQEALTAALDGAGAGPDAGSVGLLLIDLDNFKMINDTAGHASGDQLLLQVGQRLQGVLSTVAHPGDMVGRFGGDEFMVIAPALANPAQLRDVAEAVLAALRTPVRLDGMEVNVSASIGSCVYPADAADAAELVSNADAAMYHAKAQGRDRIGEFRREMMLATQRRAELERDLRHAVEHQDLTLAYQPQFACAGKEMVGVEALLRWQHPRHGYVSPAEFIPIAEDSGLIVEIGNWVLARACSDVMALCERTGSCLSVAVNVSARQLREPGFVAVVEQTLVQTGLPADRLELELTESMLMEDLAAALRFMESVRKLGVRLSIDDFGTGYSSLAYLQDFPLNQLKIDRSFVRRLPDEGQALVSAVIGLAHKFALTVVAEGVEHEDQLAWLREAGCDVAQGFLLARPMPLSDIPLQVPGLAPPRRPEPAQAA